ncbi:amidase [Mesorhizobium sp. CC13]|uniref:amidase n=1 Tax=Mesorhizobium sp. CC13 TaxID=3029194 RepID=UPI003264201E
MDKHEQAWRLSAVQLQQRYRSGTLTPRAVAQACLARLDAVNPRINAVIARREEAMLREADAATERYGTGKPLSAMDGIPVTIKDNLATADQAATWGSPALRAHRPARDELPVARLREAGALIIGKTNLPEFALEGYTDNRLFGVTSNPWNLALTPGGSSGGAVAGLAAGIAPLALGTDGGGSIRRPASHCGLVGFKPSIGAVARAGGLPSLLLDFEVVGPLARTVADARMMFDVLRGPRATDWRSFAASGARQTPRQKPLRILYVPTIAGAPVDPEIAANCAGAAKVFQSLGHIVDEGEMPLNLDFMTETWPLIGQVGLARLFEAQPEWRGGAASKYLDMAEAGAKYGASRLWRALEDIERLRQQCAAVFDAYDMLVTPAAAALPWPAREAYPPTIAGQSVGPRGHAVFTGWVNAAGLPALAVPAAPSSTGLPIGIQLIGAYGADDLLLDLGDAYEAAAPWADRWPDL